MTALTDTRLAVAPARMRREVAMRVLTDAEMLARPFRDPSDGSVQDDPGVHGAEWSARRSAAITAIESARAGLRSADQACEEAHTAYAALARAAPLFEPGCVDPVLLLPIRIEAVYRATPTGEPELHVRVYPDDVHVDSHEPELTDAEHAAGTAYWLDVRATAASAEARERRRVAWHVLTGAVGGRRAAWVREVLTPTDGGGGVPTFPEVARRPAAWNRGARTLLLPDRFEFSAYRDGALVWRHQGADLPDELPLGIAPAQPDGGPDSDLPFDDASRWLVDFRAAVALGMGLVVPLARVDERYDLLTVVGVGGQDAETGAARVQDALAAHAWSGGLAPVPIGTPTNNTPGSRSGWQSRAAAPDPDAVGSWLGSYDPDGHQDAARLARALGVDGAEVLARVCDPATTDEPLLRTAHRLESELAARSWLWHPRRRRDRLLATPDPPTWFAAAQQHYTEFVRGRGPLPPLRVGRQPYGVLPASSVQLWRADGDEEVIAHVVASFHDAFSEHVDRAAQVGEGPDQDAELLDLLSREAGPQWFKGWEAWYLDRGEERRPVPPATIGAVPHDLRWAEVCSQATPQTPEELAQPDTAAPEPQVVEPFPDTIPDALRAFLAQRPLLRLLDLYDRLVTQLESTDPPEPVSHAAIDQLLEAVATHENTLWQVTRAPTSSFYYSQALAVAHELGRTLEVDQPTDDNLRRAAVRGRELVRVLAIHTSLEAAAVEDLPRVERLVREAKHPLSLRVDAWVTSLATRRLADLRATAPTGVRTGAYGWLTDVEVTTPNPPREGYVVTPSLHHATTAAVLRSGWQAHQDRSAFAVDIQSARARRAQVLLDGVRGGQTAGALLGYQFERALHDAGLDRFVAGFRTAYPLAPLVDPTVTDATRAREHVGARTVVDGQALRRDRAELVDDAVLAGKAGAPLDGAGTTLLRLVGELDETFDAAADLLLAESVHQLVGGSALRAGLAADAVGRGQELPRDFEVLRTPRSGTSSTHHVGVLLPDRLEPGTGWSDTRPLARLEPGLEGWVRTRLGATASWSSGAGFEARGWCALDVLAASPDGVRAAMGAPADPDELHHLAVLCGSLRGVLAASQPLSGLHLGSSGPAVAAVDLDDLLDRVGPWMAGVRTAAASLEAAGGDELAPHLETLAAHGVVAGPGSPAAARQQLLDRVGSLRDPGPVPDTAVDVAAAEAWLGGLVAAVAAALPPWLVLAPRLVVDLPPGPDVAPAPDEVGDWWRDMTLVRPAVAALDAAVVGCEVAGHGVAFQPTVLQPVAPGERPGPWLATAPASERPGSRVSLVLDVPAAVGRPRGLVVDSWTEVVPSPPRAAADGVSRGPEEVVGVAFDFDRPDARAPQSLLLAVPPDPSRGWSTEDLHACVEETLHLARVRALILSDVPELSRQVPPPLGVAES